jgi:hypothetical protein
LRPEPRAQDGRRSAQRGAKLVVEGSNRDGSLARNPGQNRVKVRQSNVEQEAPFRQRAIDEEHAFPGLPIRGRKTLIRKPGRLSTRRAARLSAQAMEVDPEVVLEHEQRGPGARTSARQQHTRKMKGERTRTARF